MRTTYLLLLLGWLLSMGCERKQWEDHYGNQPETVDKNLWEVIRMDENASVFTSVVEELGYDSLFANTDPYTLFIPSDAAFEQFLDTGGVVSRTLLEYHISVHVMQSMSITGKQKVQTLGEKFALFQRSGGDLRLDGIPISFESPVYRNGKYFLLDEVAVPRPNLYEFFAVNNPILRDYIDSKDSIILDKELSRPLGFDDDGNTIYDSVSITLNTFEEEFFPVSEEFRFNTATIVFPLEEDYNAALTEMAQFLGSVYTDYSDIPLVWQNRILIPYLLEHGVFENMLEEQEFLLRPSEDTIKLKNILGDSVVIEYEVADKVLCSNGYAYNYQNFVVPDTLYKGSYRYEGEWLLLQTGVNRYAWDPDKADVDSDVPTTPIKDLVAVASNDSTLKVNFEKGYSGAFSLEFNVPALFPREYLMVVQTDWNLGGVYNVYVNDEQVATIDWYTFLLNQGFWFSVTGKELYAPDGRLSRFDCYVENRGEYGETRVRFEYIAPGSVLSNGLVIDYVEFFPIED